jgi:hypothetical protein
LCTAPGGLTPLQLRYRPVIVGQEKIQVHVVDTDTRELVRGEAKA